MTQLKTGTDDVATDQLESAIYQGFVRHRRFTPRPHEFRYPLFMLLLKLSELPVLEKGLWQLGQRPWHWARFKRSDYLGPLELPLEDAVRQEIGRQLGQAPVTGEVFLLGHLRYLGLYFSPLNLYFLRQQGSFRYMLAEVSNTPWNQRHYYLLDLENLAPHDKAFHVSPFNPMDQRYRWRLVTPDAHHSKAMVHLESAQQDTPGDKVFDATMVLKRLPLNQTQLGSVLLKTPVQTASMVAGIYWQALKLFVKGVPFHGHPNRKQVNQEGTKVYESKNSELESGNAGHR
ncbi:MAG: hypothetical protein RLZZ385_2460 [Pseudomonadota bacterium]